MAKISENINKFITDNKFEIIYFIVLVIFNFPFYLFDSATGLDPSWVVGLHLSHLADFNFGSQIIFTYGPLGYLNNAAFIDYSLFSQALIFNLAIYFLFFLTIFVFLKKCKARWYHYLILLPISWIIGNSIDYEIILIGILILFLVLCYDYNPKEELFFSLFSGFLLAVASLIKFNAFIIAASIFFAIAVCLVLQRKQLDLFFYTVVGFAISFLCLWIFSGQKFYDIIQYILTGFSLSQGYTDAMSIDYTPVVKFGINVDILYLAFLGYIIAINLILLLLFIISFEDKRFKPVIFLLLSVGFLFATIKHGLVRFDLHVLYFFAGYTYILFFVFVIISQSGNDKKNNILLFLRIAVLFIILSLIAAPIALIGSPGDMDPTRKITTIPNNIFSQIHYLSNINAFSEEQSAIKQKNIEYYNYSPLLIDEVDQHSVDVIPWDIGAVWAYNLNWSPRPIFQSYSVYTSSLDRLNNDHFNSNKAPEYIIYSYGSINNRYPIYDEPAAFRTILEHYNLVGSDGPRILLKRNSNSTKTQKIIDLGDSVGYIGEPIQVPNTTSGLIFANITMKKTIKGEVLSIIFKPSQLYIQFFPDEMKSLPTYRFIPAQAKDGVIINKYFGNVSSVEQFYSEGDIARIDKFIISEQHPGDYSKEVEVHFWGIE